MQRLFLRAYFFGALPVPLADAAAAVVFGFSFFGFLASRFPFGMAAAPSSGLSIAPVGEITSVCPSPPSHHRPEHRAEQHALRGARKERSAGGLWSASRATREPKKDPAAASHTIVPS